MIKRILTIVSLIVALSNAATAQTRKIEHDFSDFDAVVVSDGFNVTMNESDAFSIQMVVDDALESYVQCYVKGRTLYLGLDTKEIPKDLKKSYKGKNSSSPVLKAVVYMPKLNSLTLSGEATFTSPNPIKADKLNLSMADNSSITGLTVVSSENATITASHKSKISMKIQTDDLVVNTSGNASLTMDFVSVNTALNNSGSADLSMNGECKDIKITTNRGAKLMLTGKAKNLVAEGSGNSSATVDASAFKVDDAKLSISGMAFIVNAEDNIEFDLGKGSDVTYLGDPDVKITSIQSSSVSRK